jgi:hypothetical protein
MKRRAITHRRAAGRGTWTAALVAVSLLTAGAWLTSACGDNTQQPKAQGDVPPGLDKDGDGLPDSWERDGVDYVDPTDGVTRRLDLKKMGASPAHKDILLWLVWMETPTGSNAHTHEPDSAALALVEQAFKSAPVKNPDGVPGINLHIIKSRKPAAEVETLGSGPMSNYNWSAFDAVKKAHLPSVLEGKAFFTVFAHFISPNQDSGLARGIPGRDFLVSLGGFTGQVGTRDEKAGTLMHELGHALGLHHGGRDDVQWKPNYLSVMNYSFQMNGLWISGRQGNFDYSRFILGAPEATLDEKGGLTSELELARYGTLYYCCATCKTPNAERTNTVFVATNVDWNCDTNFGTSVSTDVNRDKGVSELKGANDWENIVFTASSTTGVTPGAAGGVPAEEELTPQIADAVPLFPVSDVHARRIGNGVLVEWAPVPLARVVAYRVYRAKGTGAPTEVATIENTDNPSYADVSAGAGNFSYTVSALFVPHAFQPQPPPEAAPSALGRPGARWIQDHGAIAAVVKAAPNVSVEMENLGGVTPPQPATPTTFKVLRETTPSTVARVQVQ